MTDREPEKGGAPAVAVSGILDTGFRLLRERALLLISLGALLCVPLALGLVAALQGVLRPAVQAGAGVPELQAAPIPGARRVLPVAAAIGAWSLVVGALVHIALVHAAAELHARRGVTAGGALRTALRLFLPCAGTVALVAAFHAAFLATVGLPGRLAASGAVAAAGYAVFAILGAYALCSLVLLGPVMVIERRFWLAAVRRSHALMAGNRLRGLAVAVLAFALVSVLAGTAQAIWLASPWAGALAWGIVQAAGTAWTCAVWVALYVALRSQAEALDAAARNGPAAPAGSPRAEGGGLHPGKTLRPDVPGAPGMAAPPLAVPRETVTEVAPAGPTARIIAYGIDCAVILMAELVLAAALLLSPAGARRLAGTARDLVARLGGDGSPGVAPEQLQLGLAVLAAALALQFVLEFAYFFASEVLGRGRSPGKRLVGLQVVRADGRPLTAGASFVRNLLRSVDLLPGTYVIGLTAIAATRRHQRLGDLVAGTLVVRRDRGGAPEPLPAAGRVAVPAGP